MHLGAILLPFELLLQSNLDKLCSGQGGGRRSGVQGGNNSLPETIKMLCWSGISITLGGSHTVTRGHFDFSMVLLVSHSHAPHTYNCYAIDYSI